MTAEIRTVVSQLNIIQGEWERDTPNQVAVREPKATDGPGVGKGDLFVLVEVQGITLNRTKLEHQLAQLVRDSYYLARGSVTAALRRSLQAAATQLYRRNIKAAVEDRVIAGIVALAICGDDAFLAQSGPAAFYTILGERVQRYPAQSIWLDDDFEGEEEPLLGLTPVIEPVLHHIRLNRADMIVLADSALASHLATETVRQAAASREVESVTKALSKLANTPEGSVLAVAAIEGPTSRLEQLRRSATTLNDRLFGSKEAATPTPGAPVSAEFTSPTLLQSLTSRFGFATKEDEDTVDDLEDFEDDRLPEPAPVAPPELKSPKLEPTPNSKVLASSVPESTFSTMSRQQPHQTEKENNPAKTAGNVLRWIGSGLLVLISLLGQGIKNIFTLMLPGIREDAPRQAGAAHTREERTSAIPWTLLRNIAIAIPLIVGLIVAVSYIQQGRVVEAEYAGFIQTAQSKFQQAQAVSGDPGSALGLMAEAETALVQAEQIKANQPEIAAQRAQMAAFADQISEVERLSGLVQLRRYTEAGTDLKRIVVQGLQVFVLDEGTDRLYNHTLDDSGVQLLPDDDSLLLLARDQQVENVAVAELLDMTWMPAGGNRQTSDLVILNSTGLLEFNPNWGATTSALAAPEQFVRPVSVSSYFGNFYVLDPGANLLLRYLPTADGYSAPPENYFAASEQPVDLTGAVDFAIDGAIYVLYNDGRVLKFEGGTLAPFEVTGLDVPMRLPSSIYTTPDENTQYVYVVDSGNQRIVQLEKDGQFVRQFKPAVGEATTFGNVQDIFVDEIGSRMFILDDNNLYLATLPGVEAAAAPEEAAPAVEEAAPAAEQQSEQPAEAQPAQTQ